MRSVRLSSIFAALALAVTVLVTGCAHSDPNTSSYRFPEEGTSGSVPAIPTSSSTLRIGDMITVSFSDLPSPGIPEVKARIPADGMLTLNYNVRVQAAGRTIPQLEQEIRAAFVPKYYRQLTAIVRAEDRAFYVGGEVRTPNRFPLLGEVTVLRAIETAGSFTDYANRNKIELRRENGQTFMLSEKEIKKNPALDLPVLANDHIRVHRRIF
jgi:protein involved in polysaccharide export with SLBB domain